MLLTIASVLLIAIGLVGRLSLAYRLLRGPRLRGRRTGVGFRKTE